jgi:hypothetical protein
MTKQGEATHSGTSRLVCSFCDKSKDVVKKLIAGPGVYMCDQCLNLCNKLLDGIATAGLSNTLKLAAGQSANLIKCSFCGKKQNLVVTGQIITGPPGNNICAECVELCNTIVYEELLDAKEDKKNRDLRLKLKARIGRESNLFAQPQTAGDQQIFDALNIIMAELTAIKERLDKLEARKPD